MRIIDADALKAVKFHPLPYTHIVPTDADAESYKWGWNDAIDAIIESAPTIDAVPVVRCKDCEFYTEEERWCRRLGLCGAFDTNDFCSHAERSEE